MFFFNVEGEFCHQKNGVQMMLPCSKEKKMDKTRYGTQPFTGTDPNSHNLSAWLATSESSALPHLFEILISLIRLKFL
jgi:hypothetical protein